MISRYFLLVLLSISLKDSAAIANQGTVFDDAFMALPDIENLKPSPNDDKNPEVQKYYDESRKGVIEGDKEKFLPPLFEGLKKFPNSFLLLSKLAAVVGDHANETKDEKKYLVYSRKLFDLLNKHAEMLPLYTSAYFRNEYCYRHSLYQKQYELGVELEQNYTTEEAYPQRFSFYSQGVGAANFAYKLAKDGKKSEAKEWAEKSVIAWEKYHKIWSYYNAYVHHSLALGILGRYDDMQITMETGAKLVNQKPEEHREFIEVSEWIQAIK